MFKRFQAFIFFFIFYSKGNIAVILLELIILLYKLTYVSYIRLTGESILSYWRYNFFDLPMIKRDDELEVVLRLYNKGILKKVKKRYISNIRLMGNIEEKISDIFCDNMELIGDKMIDLSGCVIKNLVCERISLLKLDAGILPYSLRKLVMRGCGLEEVNLRLDSLEEIDLSNNRIDRIKLDCCMLRKINGSNNRILYCDLKCDNLEEIDFSNNRLEDIRLGGGVMKLNLENNNFVVLPVELLKIEKLYLDGNPVIPNLNEYVWMEYFEKNYLHFFENNMDMRLDNIYKDSELVHNPHINYSVKECIKELLEVNGEYVDIEDWIINNENESEIRYLCDCDLNSWGFNVKIKKIFEKIFYLGKKKKCIDNILPILDEEIKEGKKYCLNGKIGRIITAIMGFKLIKNVVRISRNDEIMMQYNIVKKRVGEDVGRMREELRIVLENSDIEEEVINEWVNAIE